MNIEKLRSLKKNSGIKINGIDYNVTDIDRGITPSDEVKEFTLKDKQGREYLLQIVLNKSASLWRIETNSLIGKPYFGESNLIRIKSIEC